MIITIFGNSGSGKTAFSSALSKELATSKNNTNVILISFDQMCPAMTLWAPQLTIPNYKYSIGTLFEELNINSQTLSNKIVTIDNEKNLGLLGYCSKDYPLAYAEVQYESITAVIQAANSFADFVIIDLNSDISNLFAAASLSLADKSICLLTPDIKGKVYFNTCEEILKNPRFGLNEAIIVSSNFKKYNDIVAFQNVINRKVLQLPYDSEVEISFMEGNLFNINKKCGLRYKNTLHTVVNQLRKLNTNEETS